MSDTIEVKLPISGKSVTIRNYTTVADDEAAEALLYQGVELDQQVDSSQAVKIKFPLANMIASQKAYVPLLVQSIDGDTDVEKALKNLRSKDYQAIVEAVDKIIGENSPKPNGNSSSSNKS